MRNMIIVYSDDKKLMFELLAKGREIADCLNKPLVGVSIGKSAFGSELDLIHHGADQVVTIGVDQEYAKAEEYSEILINIINELPAEIVIIGNTKNGKEIAARTAGHLDTGCITDCTKLYLSEDKNIVAERIVYGGNALAVQSLSSSPKIYTMIPRVIDALPKDDTRKGEIIKKEGMPTVSSSKIIKVQEKKVEGVNIEDAEIIVACGRGVKKKEDISLIKELADLLHGETIGCTRPISADLNWLSED
ncbi:MAG: electron transfer flavoprotein subunit alpha/FixB family protein, partial [Candidatus Aminicenantes bacterium]|nr:electron transfer flavoprotein subunit alpha/FixB family protein [Candidatus Aminicenantes bacterium]